MTLTERLLGELTQEADTTRRVLERVPRDRMSWRPHPKSLSLGQLAYHVAFVPRAIADLASAPEREIPTVPRPEATSTDELLSTLAQSIDEASTKVRGFGDEGLDAMVRLTRGGQTVLQMPRYNLLRAVLFNHWYHHRGQLTVYLRLLDVAVPSVYGPSADEQPF
jgi:uncharacterized damage-inducible protein DinB